MSNRHNFDLVLGSGGIKGFGHIGLIKAIEELPIQIDQITGVSIGAIVGVFLANGFNSSEIAEIMIEESGPVTFGGSALDLVRRGILCGGINLRTHAERVVQRYKLKPQEGLHLIAFDLRSLKPVFFQGKHYNLADAMAASAAVPVLMRPVLLRAQSPGACPFVTQPRTQLLIDGAAHHPYPTNFCKGRTIISKIGSARYLPVRKINPLDFVILLGDIATGRFFSKPVRHPEHHLIDVGMPDAAGLCFGVARSRFEAMIEFGYHRAKATLPSLLQLCQAGNRGGNAQYLP